MENQAKTLPIVYSQQTDGKNEGLTLSIVWISHAFKIMIVNVSPDTKPGKTFDYF